MVVIFIIISFSKSDILNSEGLIIVKLRSRSREGQLRVSKVKNLPELYSIFGFHHLHPTTHQKLFLALEGSRNVRWA